MKQYKFLLETPPEFGLFIPPSSSLLAADVAAEPLNNTWDLHASNESSHAYQYDQDEPARILNC